MADDTNIDEILKSIDALLKEGEAEDDSEQKDKQRRDVATNDDEIVPDLEGDKVGDESQVSQDEQHLSEQHADELQQAADAADMDDHPTNLSIEADIEEADTEEMEVPPIAHAIGRRIVLSESMVVEDTPDRPFDVTGIQTAIEENQSENGALGEVFSDEPNPDLVAADYFAENSAEWPESEDSSSPEVPENEVKDDPSVDTSELDINELVEQITADISARLQQQLPGMVAGMVAEAMQKNLAAHAATDHESTDDTQN